MARSQQITAHFRLEHRDDGILVYYIADISRYNVDAWFRVSTHHDQAAAADNAHLCRLFLATSPRMMSTPYLLSRLTEADKLTPKNLKESGALVVTDSLTLRFAEMMLNRVLSATQQNIRIFRQQDSANKWLHERITTLGEPWRAPDEDNP